MSQGGRVLAVVPTRGGPTGLSARNVRPLAGVPLIGHSLRAAELVTCIDRCVVSTDAADIAETARALGGDVPFLRPAELDTDDTSMAPVLVHALTTVEGQESATYDFLVLLDPTSPARAPADVDAAVELLRGHDDWDGVVSVSTPTFHPVWVGVRAADRTDRLERYFPEAAGATRRQQMGPYLRVNGNFVVWRTPFVRRMDSSWFDEGVHGMIEVPESRAFAIDHDDQFDRLEALIAQGIVTLPWLGR